MSIGEKRNRRGRGRGKEKNAWERKENHPQGNFILFDAELIFPQRHRCCGSNALQAFGTHIRRRQL
jgi:hypothetical protein